MNWFNKTTKTTYESSLICYYGWITLLLKPISRDYSVPRSFSLCHKRTVCTVLDCWLSRNGIITTSHQLNSISLEWVLPSKKLMRLIVRDHQNDTRSIFVTFIISFPLLHKPQCCGSKNSGQGHLYVVCGKVMFSVGSVCSGGDHYVKGHKKVCLDKTFPLRHFMLHFIIFLYTSNDYKS